LDLKVTKPHQLYIQTRSHDTQHNNNRITTLA
jgi:hypothetical protein